MGSYWYSDLTLITSSWRLIRWYCWVTWQNKNISTTTIRMATKLDEEVTYPEELPLTKIYDPSVTWSCEITWHIKYFLSPLALKAAKLKATQCGASTHKFIQPFNYVFTWGHVTNQKYYVSTMTMLMVTRHQGGGILQVRKPLTHMFGWSRQRDGHARSCN